MKRITALLTLITICLALLCSCSFFEQKTTLRIGYMAGPTGMGMAKLVSDNGGLENGNEKYVFAKYADTAAAKADLAAGKIDFICLPTNEAAMYYNTVDSSAKVLAVNCLNSLYLIMNSGTRITSFSLLTGQTLYTCKNGTPRMILEHIIEEAGIDATVSYTIDGKEMITPADLSAMVVAGKIPNAVMPEPLVTSSILAINSSTPYKHLHWSVKVDLADEWSNIYDTPITMGCIVASGDVIKNHKSAVNAFLEEYKASIEYIGNLDNLDSAADYVVESGVMGAVPAAKSALENLSGSISYIEGEEMKKALVAFYNAIGISLPDDEFYYAK